jgi:transcription antitermination factor NusG
MGFAAGFVPKKTSKKCILPLDKPLFVCYIMVDIMRKEMTVQQEAQLLLNQEVKINVGQFAGKTALVRKVMADGRSLEVEIARTSGKIAFVDVTFVSEIQERTQFAKTEQSLGPIANHLVKDTL